MRWIIVLLLVALAGCTPSNQQACTNSGGTVSVGSCCLSANDFPNTCLIGACGCSPDNSRNVQVCDCGAGKCFDGTKCVAR